MKESPILRLKWGLVHLHQLIQLYPSTGSFKPVPFIYPHKHNPRRSAQRHRQKQFEHHVDRNGEGRGGAFISIHRDLEVARPGAGAAPAAEG